MMRDVGKILAMLRDLRAHHNLEGMALTAQGWETLLNEIDRLQAPPRPSAASPALKANSAEATHRVDQAIEKLGNGVDGADHLEIKANGEK